MKRTQIKKLVCLFVICMLTMPYPVCAATFSDVTPNSEYYDSIKELSEKGILNGYEDGTFRPKGHITRAEAATVIVRAAGLPTPSVQSTYSDVKADHWALRHIMAATKAGIINGMGNGVFSASGDVTYNQIIKMIVCMVGLENQAAEQGGWPSGYVYAAYHNRIIDSSEYYEIQNHGNNSAPRQDVARFLHNALTYKEEGTLHIANKTLHLGMKSDSLDSPDAVLQSTGNFVWYVYGTDTYKNFYTVGVNNNRVVALAATGTGFSYMGYHCGDLVSPEEQTTFMYTDSNDNFILHSVLLLDASVVRKKAPTEEEFIAESKMNFHFTNAFRAYHQLNILQWNDLAAQAAKLHSEDMANNNYFNHTNPAGASPGERMTLQGVQFSGWGENIAAGTIQNLGFHSFDGWVNSEGHRRNMLKKQYTHLGVGIAYNPDSQYCYYHTQNFFTGQ